MMKNENPELDLAKDILKAIGGFFRSIGAFIERIVRRRSIRRRILAAEDHLIMDLEKDDVGFSIIFAIKNREVRVFIWNSNEKSGLEHIIMDFKGNA